MYTNIVCLVRGFITTSMVFYAIRCASLAILNTCAGSLINGFKGKCERKWFGMNIIFVSIALCVACGELLSGRAGVK